MPEISYFNPRSPRGERRGKPKSLHRFPYFNPRSPRGERLPSWTSNISPVRFQSTLPSRGATLAEWLGMLRAVDFNPRSPRGERLQTFQNAYHSALHFNPRSPRGERHGWRPPGQASVPISIHAPLAGSDLTPVKTNMKFLDIFQSTLPSRGATSFQYG